ncbi:hypothetical protein H6A23_04525 [Olsenella uli]|uniref:hypothetical protein n=1 Tax=Olsenella uli TaxID=133926 RepID=UPI0019597904|nr:hypothetical protein [Olsenella uli]MBM6816432.1 hypothetical protein [Olsenella uli]
MTRPRINSLLALALAVGLETVWALPAQAEGISDDVNIILSYEQTAHAMPRSWYGSTMVLYTTFETASHHYDGSSVGIEMTCVSSSSGTFGVTLMRVEGSSSASLGTATFMRNGFTKATWEGVGSGVYYFVMSKPLDGVRVTSSDIAMYSW